jgi:hypothetical protein
MLRTLITLLLRSNKVNPAELNSLQTDYIFCRFLDFTHTSSQHNYLQTLVLVQMNVHCGNRLQKV